MRVAAGSFRARAPSCGTPVHSYDELTKKAAVEAQKAARAKEAAEVKKSQKADKPVQSKKADTPVQTSIDDSDHGGHHRFHDNVHTGTPGTDGRGNTFDKQGNLANYPDCVERGMR